MEGSGAPRRDGTARLRAVLPWLAARPVRQLGLGVLLVGLVLSAPFGGWREVGSDAVRAVRPGAEVTTGPLVVTVENVTWAVRPAESFEASPVGAYLLVYGTARNVTDAPVGGEPMTDTIRLVGVDGLVRRTPTLRDPVERWQDARPTVYHRDDAEPLPVLGPGLTYPVAWAFEWSGEGAALPATLTVEVRAQTLRERSTTRELEWLDSAPTATATLPVRHGTEYVEPGGGS